MAIKGLLYLYIMLTAMVSLMSYKKGIYMVWLTFLFVPTVILEQSINLRLPMLLILMFGSVVSELRFYERRDRWREFISDNQKAIILLLFVSFVIVLMSETVPIGMQLRRVLLEITTFAFAIQTLLLVKEDETAHKKLFYFICAAIVFNVIYSVFFEVMLGVNPAGMPLYILLGIDDNEFIVDMIETQRGGLSFRAQTIYRHPLSLAQYMLVLLPIFLSKGERTKKFLFVLLIILLIFLSGSRGALVPMGIILLMSAKSVVGHFAPKLAVLFILFVVGINFLSDNQRKKIDEKIEPFVAGFAFWDAKKQYSNDISGSSMQMRFNQFDAALVEIEGNPIFGRGYGYREYWISKHNDLHPDLLGFESVLLLYLVERGWLGLLFFFVMAIYVYKLFRVDMSDISDAMIIRYVFIGYIISIVMTGVRPLTFLFVCLACSVYYGMTMWQKEAFEESVNVES